MLEPSHRQRLQRGIRRVRGFAPQERLPPDQGRAPRRQLPAFRVGAVHIGVAPEVLHPAQDRVVLHLRNHDPPGRIGMPLAMMAHETAAQHVVAPIHLLAVDLVRQRPVEPVVSGAQREDRPTRIDVVDDELALRHRQGQQARIEQDEVGFRQQFQARDVVFSEGFPLLGIHRHRGIHLALLVHREEHRAIEAMMRAEDLRHHRHGLFAAVLLVRCDQDDPLAPAGTGFAGVFQPEFRARGTSGAQPEETEEDRENGGEALARSAAANAWGFH